MRVIGISLVVTYGEHVGGNRLVTLGLKLEERHRVMVYRDRGRGCIGCCKGTVGGGGSGHVV